jgi:hypothetical protein
MPQPSVGRIVHYVSHGSPAREDGTQEYTSECRAAVITVVKEGPNVAHSGIVDLCVLNPTGVHFVSNASFVIADRMIGGTWHWPEQVS